VLRECAAASTGPGHLFAPEGRGGHSWDTPTSVPLAPTFPVLGLNPQVTEVPSYSLPPSGVPLATETDPTDHVFGDVKCRFLGLTRISNLITTRSDSFTVYAQVQAWQNVGTQMPTLIATKRAAALLDRSQVKPVRTPTGNAITFTPLGATNLPND
jgi:hypothetical protein